MKSWEANKVFGAYRSERDVEKKRVLELQLLNLLEHHAHAVCWETLHQRRPDIVNEALFRAFQAMESFRGESLFSTWFHRIVINCCNTYATREAKEAERVMGIEDMAHEPISPDARASESLAYVLQVIRNEEREFYVKKMNGATDEELAEYYGLSPAGVRVRWHRIRKKLRELLSHT